MSNTYPGGKARLYQWLINHIPPHDTYIATHLGHDAIMRFKRPARSNIGIDADVEVIDWWARWDPTAGDIDADDEAAAPPATPRMASTAQDNGEGLHHQPQRYLPARTVNHNDMARAQRAPATYRNGDAQYTFIHADAHQWLRYHYHSVITGNEFVYSDPPYLFVTRKQRNRPLYNHEYTVAQHVDLLSLLKALPCPVMISGYESDIYNDMLAGWHKDTINTTTRGGTPATEVIWMNYPPPTALHDYRYLGEGYRERERIKKLKRRWVTRWKNMSTLQRQAVLAAIQEANQC
ncbi:MAG: hypothetical protein DCC55_22515 [Chloroflexi bacterium]|nr:MAG: hypothetical protein DCC55_22515 [Chloroflexota bacterium]